MRQDSPHTVYLKDYRLPDFLVDSVDLHFELGEDETVVRSILAIRRNPQVAATGQALHLDGQGLILDRLVLNGRRLEDEEYHIHPEGLSVPAVPDRFELEVVTRIRPQDNTWLEGLYRSGSNFCTQCEAEGFRKITYYPDRPDVMTVYTTTLVADRGRYPVLLSNGDLVASGALDGGRHFATWHDPFPKPSYLFALVAGDLACHRDRFRTRSGREVDLRIYVEAHNIDRCEHAMAALKKAMAWDERRFGLEYDLDTYMIVAVDDFNMGAMENKGLNLFNSKYVLARPETATDADYTHIEAVIAHEYFHNWTGNRVTCRDWFQLSLKEGLTVFRDQEFTAETSSRAVKRIHDVRQLRTLQFAEDAGPMAHPVRPQSYMEINNFYTVTVYEKGAEVVRMLHTLLGREGFRKGMDRYFERHDGQAVTTDDFVAAMADANGVDLSQCKRWYDQSGTPVLEVEDDWDPRGRYTLEISQSCPPTPGQAHKAPFDIPLRIGLLGCDGGDLPLQLEGEDAPSPGTSRVLRVREPVVRYTFTGLAERPVPSLLRDCSAPVVLRYPYVRDQLAFLLAHDTDPFNRWEAGQRLAVDQLMRLIEAEPGTQPSVDGEVLAAFGRLLGEQGLDDAFVAELLTLPGESYLAELTDAVDVDAIHGAREALRGALMGAHEGRLVEMYRERASSGPYVYTAQDAGRRRLRNVCLGYLVVGDDPGHIELAMGQYRSADNMTDTMGALSALRDSLAPQREEALRDFESRWRHDPLVMDKWFSLQAGSARQDTLETVKRLMGHPLFSLKNPNRVRALIGAFAAGNPLRFHEASGAGYAFVAAQIQRLDPLNPQIAARLARAFTDWRKYDPARQALIREQLERLARQPGISSDLNEVVTKSLGDG